MKRILLVVAILATAFSCKKDKNDDAEAKFCYSCTVNQVVDGVDMGMTTTTEQCEITEAQKNAFEKAGSTTTTGNGVTMKVTVKCTKK